MKLARFNNRPEIFYSIQGEGKNVGLPAVFVRLAHCNLKCVWCDTPYTWNWKKFDPKKEIVELSVSAVAKAIQRYPCRNVIFTGGEPMLQQSELVALMRKLKPKGYWFEIETNATVMPTLMLDQLIDQYNCSPKLKNSGNPRSERKVEKPLRFFANSPKAIFKFVLTNQKEIAELEALLKKCAISRERVYLMPEGKTAAVIFHKTKWLASLCKAGNLHFSDRLHIRLFGDRRGS